MSYKLKNIMVRKEDYWIYALSICSILTLGAGLYTGSSLLRITLVAMGLTGVIFLAHIIHKNYSAKLSSLLTMANLILSVTLALTLYSLTK